MAEEKQPYDVIIIGAGPAGLTAGIYASRLGLKTLILEAKTPGGRAEEAWMIENFPGFPEGITGKELIEKMTTQALKFGAETKLMEKVIDLNFGGELKRATTLKGTYQSFALIIATGTQRKRLKVPGETEFLGRGVSYCSICDGFFFKNLRVAVVGSSEEAISEALFLADTASEVLLVMQEKEFNVVGALKKKLQEKKNLKIINGKIIAIQGESVVKSIKINEFKTGREIQEKVSGVFISLEGVPTTEIVKKAGIDTDRNGCIIVDRWQRTNIEGVFAVGDCTCGGMQIITSAGEGAMAAMKASAYTKIRR